MKDSVQKTSTAALGRAVRWVGLGLLAVLFSAGATFAQINAYVVTQGNASLTVLDTATNTVTATVPGLVFPRAVALSPDEHFVYATTLNGMAKIDTLTNTITGTVATGNNPIGIAVTSDGATAYVANNASGTISVVDTATMTVTMTLPIFPSAIAITPDRTAVWVGSNILSPPFPGTIFVIDPTTNTFTTFPIGHGTDSSNGIAFTPDGAFAYLALFGSNLVGVIDTATQTEVATSTAGNRPGFPAVSPDGAFTYVTNILSNDVSIIDTATNSVVATVPVGARPREVAFTPDGAFAYVTNNDGSSISVIDTVTRAVVSTIPMARPWGIAIMHDSDHDGVPNNRDNCPSTAPGDPVDSTGCSIAQLCPCAGPWKNHGKYVSCVAHAAESFLDAGLITEAQKDAFTSAAGQSSCGK